MNRLEVTSKFVLALAATMTLLISGVLVPPAGILLLPFVPQPVLSFGLRYGKKLSFGVLLSALVLFLGVGRPDWALLYAVFGLMAMSLFFLFHPDRPIETIVVASAGSLLTAVGTVLIYSYGSWSQLVQGLRASLEEHLEISLRTYEEIGFAKENVELLRESAPQIVDTVLQIMPALVFVSFGLIALINLCFLWRRFPEQRAAWFSTENLREWKGPEWLVWCLIACGFVLLLPSSSALKVLAVNVLLVIAVFYFFQGLAIVAFYFDKKNVPRFLRGLTYLLIFFEQIFTLLVVGLGLFDLWGDFRRLNKKDLSPGQLA